ncbi:MAG: CoA transferase [Candidatus Sericytochromatia bacterium]|nr:MAG: CoA transferase [Candidatus Sericytochromatia bacterium]
MNKIIEFNQENKGPLNGIKVLDFTMLLPGPLCTMHLGDMGAEVIKVEHPIAFDNTRKMGPYFSEKNINSYYYLLNRNKKSIAINYKRKDGVEILKRIIPKFDIIVEGFRPGMMDEIGLGYEEIKKIKPDVIYCSISGFGKDSPYKDFAGHDANYLALSGILDLIGDEKPILPAIQIADILGGTLSALTSILAALYYREKTGEGQYLDVSITDSVMQVATLSIGDFLATKQQPKRNKTYLSGLIPNYQIYQCADGRFVVLAALEGQFFQVFLKQIQREDLLKATIDGKYEEVKKELENYFKTKTYQDLEPIFKNPNACLFPILTLEEVFNQIHFLERGTIIHINDKELGLIKIPGSPFKFSKTAISYRLPPPKLGEHTEEILKDLNIDENTYQELEKKRIILRNK